MIKKLILKKEFNVIVNGCIVRATNSRLGLLKNGSANGNTSGGTSSISRQVMKVFQGNTEKG